MNKVFTAIFIHVSILINVNAQSNINNKKPNQLSLRVGMDHTYHKDLIFSPLNNIGNGGLVVLGYRRTGKQYLLTSNIDLTYTNLTSKASQFFSYSRFLVNVDLSLLAKLPLQHEKLQAYIGAGFLNRIDLIDYIGFTSVTYFNFYGLTLNTQLAYEISSRHRVKIACALPIYGKVARPPYTGWDKFMVEHADNFPAVFYRGEMYVIGQFFGFHGQVDYAYQLSTRFDLAASYRLMFYQVNDPQESITLSNQLSIGTNFKF